MGAELAVRSIIIGSYNGRFGSCEAHLGKEQAAMKTVEESQRQHREPAPRRKRSLWLLVACAALVLLAMLGLSLFVLLRHRSTPSPVAVEIVASFPGASALMVESQVTIPLEVALTGMPGQTNTRSKSVAGLARLRVEFVPSMDLETARGLIANRLALTQAQLPTNVTPELSPATSPVLLRYLLTGPKDSQGQPVYLPRDLRAVQDWTLAREFRRVPRIMDVIANGGEVKRYELHLDVERLQTYAITPRQVKDAIDSSNGNAGSGALAIGLGGLNIRSKGLFGDGLDPFAAQGVKDAEKPAAAALFLRNEEQRRLMEIRTTVLAAYNGMPIRAQDVIAQEEKGAVVSSRPRTGWVGCGRRQNDSWTDDDDCVQGLVLLRRGEDPRAALKDVQSKIAELDSTPGKLLPGMRIETVAENLQRFDPADRLWVRAMPKATDTNGAALAQRARAFLRKYPEVDLIASQVGGAEEDGAGHSGDVRFFVRLRSDGSTLKEQIAADLSQDIPEWDWRCTTHDDDEFQRDFTGGHGEYLLKIFEADLAELQKLADQAGKILEATPGVQHVRAAPQRGKPSLHLNIDREKCSLAGITVIDVNDAIQLASSGLVATQIIEGEKTFDLVLRWPTPGSEDEKTLLQIPVVTSPPMKPDTEKRAYPRLGEFVKVTNAEASDMAAIYREQGQRFVAVRFEVQERQVSDVLSEVRAKIAATLKVGYRLEWSGD
jgi:Cu/Ag efflux pump CusA